METHDFFTAGAEPRHYRLYFGPDNDEVREAPLVLCLDADDQFTALIEAYEKLRSQGRVQTLALVGVGYGVGYRHKGNRRIPDYTPVPSPEEPVSGGGPVFLRWLREELLPWLGAERGLRVSEPALAGHSLGGLFGLYAFFHDTRPFAACLALAPSLWYAERAILDDVQAHRKKHETWPGRLFLGVGEQDSKSMRGDVERFEQELRDRPFEGLVHVTRHFPHRDHFNVIEVALCEGLAWLFPAETAHGSADRPRTRQGNALGV